MVTYQQWISMTIAEYIPETSPIIIGFGITWILINIYILKCDVQKRIIPNRLLILLWLLVPIWWHIVGIDIWSTMIPYIIASLWILLLGVLYHKKDWFLGAGDIKYAAILILMLHPLPLTVYIGNIGVITIWILVFWIWMIVGTISSLSKTRRKLLIKNQLLIIKEDINPRSVWIFAWDWLIIGFILRIFLEEIWWLILPNVETNYADFYFLLAILIFLIRPQIRKYWSIKKYTPYITIAIIWVLAIEVLKSDITMVFIQWRDYLYSMWIYILIFTSASFVSHSLFQLYDKVIVVESQSHTIPLSIVLYAAIMLSFGGISLMSYVY